MERPDDARPPEGGSAGPDWAPLEPEPGRSAGRPPHPADADRPPHPADADRPPHPADADRPLHPADADRPLHPADADRPLPEGDQPPRDADRPPPEGGDGPPRRPRTVVPPAPDAPPPPSLAGPSRTGPLPLHPMNLGDVLDGAFKLYKANARTVMGVSAAFLVPAQLVAAVVGQTLVSGLALDLLNDPQLTTADTGALAAAALASLAVLLAVPFVAGGVSVVVARSYLGGTMAAGEAVRTVARHWWALAASWVLVHVLELAGLFLCILPGLLVMALFVAVAPAVVIEELGPVRAMRRSAGLLRRRLWPVLGIAVLSGILATAVGAALSGVVEVLTVAIPSPWLVRVAGSIAVNVITTPFVAIVATLVYFDGRIRWEGFDLQVMADDLARGERDR